MFGQSCALRPPGPCVRVTSLKQKFRLWSKREGLMQGFMLECISSWMTCRKRWETMRNSIWSSSLPNVQCFFCFCVLNYLNGCQFVVWIPEWSLWRTRVKPCLIMAWIWGNYSIHFWTCTLIRCVSLVLLMSDFCYIQRPMQTAYWIC